MLRFAILAWSILMLGLTAPADAALLQFTISSMDMPSALTADPDPSLTPPFEFASFQIDATPTVDPVNVAAGAAFALANVAGIFQSGQTIRTTPQTITFYNASLRGGLIVGADATFLAYDGPQLYTGPEAAPTLRTGNFTLSNLNSGSQVRLTITQVAAVPEPASWTMMLTGFGLVGGMMRYRRRTTRAVHA